MLRSLLSRLRNIGEITLGTTQTRGPDTEYIHETQVPPLSPCSKQMKDAVEQLKVAELTVDRITVRPCTAQPRLPVGLKLRRHYDAYTN